VLARLRQTGQFPPEDERPENKAPEGDRLTFEILQDDLVAPETASGIEQSLEQRLARPRDIEPGHERGSGGLNQPSLRG
jgi:hypothetical protein